MPQDTSLSTFRTSCCSKAAAPRASSCCPTMIGQITTRSPRCPRTVTLPLALSLDTFQPAGTATKNPAGSLWVAHPVVARPGEELAVPKEGFSAFPLEERESEPLGVGVTREADTDVSSSFLRSYSSFVRIPSR